MTVIDGVHRLRAAELSGQDQIEVRFFNGTDDDAFVFAVRANIAHGLPLTLGERRAAALRILAVHREWSDRAVAAVTGLSHRTVAAIRQRSGGQVAQLHSRVGRDGRVRPVDGAHARRVAGELLARDPGASLREVARAAGISPATVRDVRERLARGADPVPLGRRARVDDGDQAPVVTVCPTCGRTATRLNVVQDCRAVVHTLARDPSLRLSESGRRFIRLLNAQLVDMDDWDRLISSIPEHQMATVAELARNNALAWSRFSEQVRQWGTTRPDDLDQSG